ncbi:MAG: mucoidy inhibitor MuiA family protein [Crocinitomicaceae bacterium]
MKKILFSILMSSCVLSATSQKEVNSLAAIKKVTVFFTGAQIQHEAKMELQAGRQDIVFQKLTDFLDPNTVQVKAQGDVTILSVRTRKNFEDVKISNEEIRVLNEKKELLYKRDQALRDEYIILEMDKNLLMQNRNLKGQDQGLKTTELKEAYLFMHTKLTEVITRETAIYAELEELQKKMNQIEQEIISQRSRPVINYSEVVVEVDVAKSCNASFQFNYISPNATWKPYYDMRSEGIGKPVRLEAKANVSQTTGIEWKDVDLVLSTNDPYENAQEPSLQPWIIYYNNYPQQKTQTTRTLPQVNYAGEKLRGEVIDASTGEAMPFAKVQFANVPMGAVTDFDGKFELIIPKGENYLTASFVGYKSMQLQITSTYLKFFLEPEEIQLQEVVVLRGGRSEDADYFVDGVQVSDEITREDISQMPMRSAGILEQIPGVNFRRKGKMDFKTEAWSNKNNVVSTTVTKKDLRVEYAIQSKMTIPTDGMDHRVSIDSHELPASYEYHVVPKIDPSVYLSAQVVGWEKLNLLSGESNIYFDGTFMGKSFLDVNSTKDTLSFSFGKDSKVSVERTRVKEKSKVKNIGSRQKFDVTWEIKIKNNGGAMIPLIVKDQYPVSNQEDIKVKQGDLVDGKLDEKTGIITWSFLKGITGTQIITFDYSVDSQYGIQLYLE